MNSFVVHGRPPDDWPGIQGADWGMGSRVVVSRHFKEVQGSRVMRIDEQVYGMVCGASMQRDGEQWLMHVRCGDKIIHVMPENIRRAE